MFLRGVVYMREGKWPERSRTEEQYRISKISCKNFECKYPLSFWSRDRMKEKGK
jgi:hypothetical protein